MNYSLAACSIFSLTFCIAGVGWSRDLSAFAVDLQRPEQVNLQETASAEQSDETLVADQAENAPDDSPTFLPQASDSPPVSQQTEETPTPGLETLPESSKPVDTSVPDAETPDEVIIQLQPNRWVFSFQPYALIPASISSTVQVGDVESTSALTLGELYQGRNFSWLLMGRAEAWKGNLGVMLDGRYQSLYLEQNARINRRGPEGRRIPLDAQGQIHSQVGALDLAFSGHLGATAPHQRPVQEDFEPAKGLWFEPFLGGRLNYLSNRITLEVGSALPNNPFTRRESLSGSGAWLSPLVGMKVGVPLNRKLDFQVYADYSGWGLDSRDSQMYRLRGVFGYWISQRAQLQLGWEYDYADISPQQDFRNNDLGLTTRGNGAFMGLMIRL
jgi:hypothetical protein